MTTVVYHNGVLATDSRYTYENSDHYEYFRDDTDRCKISLFIKDSKILAFKNTNDYVLSIAGTGNAKFIDRIVYYIKNNIHHDFNDLISVLDGFGTEDATILLICNENNYVICFSNKHLTTIKKFTKNITVTLGTGGMVAEYSIKHHKHDAIGAVKAAIEVDKDSGGDVVYVDFNNDELSISKNSDSYYDYLKGNEEVKVVINKKCK